MKERMRMIWHLITEEKCSSLRIIHVFLRYKKTFNEWKHDFAIYYIIYLTSNLLRLISILHIRKYFNYEENKIFASFTFFCFQFEYTAYNYIPYSVYHEKYIIAIITILSSILKLKNKFHHRTVQLLYYFIA